MPKWLPLPNEPIYYQPTQEAFLHARRRRFCKSCKKEYLCIPGEHKFFCPDCSGKGMRLFDRLTIIAGRRFGKSRFGSIAGVEEACIPNSIGWACAPSNPKLHRYVIPAFQKLIPDDWVLDWNSEHQDLWLKNGSLIHFQTLEDPDQGRGQGLDWLWIDEVCELTKQHWDVIRPSLGDKNGIAFFTTSPRSYDWVYEELYKKAEEGQPGFWAAHAKSADSPLFQTPEGKEFLRRERETMNDTMFRQEYEADFVTFTGAVYGDLISSQLLRSTEEIKRVLPEWPNISPDRMATIGLDTGADHPFGAVKLVSTERGLVVVGEYLERDRAFIEHKNDLIRLAQPHRVRWAINKNERQPMIELAQHGIACQPAENDQLAGIERVKSWLHNKQLWFIESQCPRTVRQFKALRWADPRKDGQSRGVAKVYKKEDELPDCVRYAVMTWPSLPEAPKPVTERRLDNFDPGTRWQIERNRRLDKPPDEDAPELRHDNDFWQ
jgi:hypothetical protein